MWILGITEKAVILTTVSETHFKVENSIIDMKLSSLKYKT